MRAIPKVIEVSMIPIDLDHEEAMDAASTRVITLDDSMYEGQTDEICREAVEDAANEDYDEQLSFQPTWKAYLEGHPSWTVQVLSAEIHTLH